MFQTEFEFTLPCGYLDEDGTLHRDGVMRRATAADEILPAFFVFLTGQIELLLVGFSAFAEHPSIFYGAKGA